MTPIQVRILLYLAKEGERGAAPCQVGFHLFPRKPYVADKPCGPRNAQGAALAASGLLRKLKVGGLIVRHYSNRNWILSQVGVQWIADNPEAAHGG